MKRYKLRKYQTPRIVQTSLESEGIFCDSLSFILQADETQNINALTGEDAEPNYIEF